MNGLSAVFFLALTAILLTAARTSSAATVNVVSEANVRGGASADSDVDEVIQGYVLVKYDGTLNNARKAYFEFDLPAGANTNYLAILSFQTAANNGRHHARLWALDQPYPEMTADLTWNTAQANQTNNNEMLTTGLFTATPKADAVIPGGANLAGSFTIPAPWGQWLHGNKLVLVLTGVNDPTNSASGLRLQPGSAAFTFQQLIGDPPSISTFTNLTLQVNQTTDYILFLVQDAQDPPEVLGVQVTSSSESVLPQGNILLADLPGDPNYNRVIALTAGAAPGTSVVTLSVTDTSGNITQTSFVVTVRPENLPPTISALSPAFTLMDTPTAAIAFFVGDAEAPELLEVTAHSTNPGLVDDTGILLGGTGTNRTVTITPAAGGTGVVPITLTVTDGQYNASSAFALMVLPATNVAFFERFDYFDGNLNPLSANFWFVRDSGANPLQVAGQQALIRSGSNYESLMAPLAWGPYAPTNHLLLYTRCLATWTELPGNSGAILHLNDGTLGVPGLIARLATTNEGSGTFRLRVANGPGPYTGHPTPLSPLVTYEIVTRFDVDTATTTLWIDPASEADQSITATDVQTPVPVVNVGFRQNTSMGAIYFDDLQITVFRKPVISSVLLAQGEVVIEFSADPKDSASDFAIMYALEVSTAYLDLGAPITPLGNGSFRATFPAPGTQAFFQVRRSPRQL